MGPPAERVAHDVQAGLVGRRIVLAAGDGEVVLEAVKRDFQTGPDMLDYAGHVEACAGGGHVSPSREYGRIESSLMSIP